MAPPQGEAVEPIPGAAEQEARWRREALRGQEGAAVIDDGHLEAGLRRQGRQRAGVVARAEDHQGGRWAEHVEEDGPAGELIEAALARLQELRGALGRGAVHLRRSGRARQLAAREHQRAARAVPFHDRAHPEPEMRTTVAIAARTPEAARLDTRSRIAAVSCQCFTRRPPRAASRFYRRYA